MKLNKNKTIKTALGTFHRAMETLNHIYFCNFEEQDENGNVLMFDRKMKLVSDNYFANVGLFEDIEKGEFTWMSKELKENVELSKENLDNTN